MRREAVRYEGGTDRCDRVRRFACTDELQKHGHEVTALVRNRAQADDIAARGASAAIADLYDRPAVAGLLAGAEGPSLTSEFRNGSYRK